MAVPKYSSEFRANDLLGLPLHPGDLYLPAYAHLCEQVPRNLVSQN